MEMQCTQIEEEELLIVDAKLLIVAAQISTIQRNLCPNFSRDFTKFSLFNILTTNCWAIWKDKNAKQKNFNWWLLWHSVVFYFRLFLSTTCFYLEQKPSKDNTEIQKSERLVLLSPLKTELLAKNCRFVIESVLFYFCALPCQLFKCTFINDGPALFSISFYIVRIA